MNRDAIERWFEEQGFSSIAEALRSEPGFVRLSDFCADLNDAYRVHDEDPNDGLYVKAYELLDTWFAGRGRAG